MNILKHFIIAALVCTSLTLTATIYVDNQTDQSIKLVITKRKARTQEEIRAEILSGKQTTDPYMIAIIKPWEKQTLPLPEKGHYDVATSCLGSHCSTELGAYVDGKSLTVFTFDMKEDYKEVNPYEHERRYVQKAGPGHVYADIKKQPIA